MKKIGFLAVAAAVVAGCTSQPPVDRNPVVLNTPQGDVTCLLYLEDQVLWDSAVSRPDQMSAEAADALCIEEGHRRLALRRNGG